jgi:hypothetical protein
MSEFEEYLKGQYIHCQFKGKSKSGKTNIYNVVTKDGTKLGEIKWYAPWRCYGWFIGDFVFETQCLSDLSKFTGNLTELKKVRRLIDLQGGKQT